MTSWPLLYNVIELARTGNDTNKAHTDTFLNPFVYEINNSFDNDILSAAERAVMRGKLMQRVRGFVSIIEAAQYTVLTRTIQLEQIINA